jgi:hypothetical protein
LGCLGATLLAVKGRTRQKLAALGLWLVLALLTALLGRWGWPWVGAPAALLGQATLLSGLASFALVGLFHQMPASFMLLPECAVFALPWVVWLSDHRRGHLQQPVALVEPAWAWGLDPFRLFAAAGLLLGVLLVLLMSSRRRTDPVWRKVFFVGLIGALCLTAIPAQKLSRFSAQIAENPAATGPTQEKPDLPVAVVVFFQDYQPELGSYHFACQSYDAPPAEPASENAVSLHYRVAEMVEQPEPLIMGWSPKIAAASAAGQQTFARLYEVKSRVSKLPLADRLALRATPSPPAQDPFQTLARQIVPESERATPLRAALRVKLWMEQNRVQADGVSPDSGSVEGCLGQNTPVGQKTFTQAAQRLLESLGWSTRLVQGYAVRADQRGQGSFLLLSQSNQRWWLELWIDQAGPETIDLYPLQGPSDGDGPNNQDLQRRLGELARAKNQAAQPLPGLGAGILGFMLFLAIVGGAGFGIKAYRHLRVRWCAPSRLTDWGYLAVLDRLAEVKEVRRTGETRQQFALRLKDRVPSLEALTHLHQKAHFGHPGGASFDNARPLVTACLKEYRHSFSAQRRWSGWLHPFAWMKVL